MKKKKNKSLCEKNIAFLSYLNTLNKSKRNKIIKNIANRNEINSIIEVFINFLNNNISCKKAFIKSMKKYTSYFDKIIIKSKSMKYKKQILSGKKGGFIISSLLSLALPIIKKIFF